MVEIKSNFDDSVTKAISKYQMSKFAKIFCVISLICIFSGVLFLFLDESLGVFLITFGVIYTPLVLLFSRFVQKRANKTLSILSVKTEEIYQFEEDKFTLIQVKGEDFRSVVESKYNYFYKVIETDTHFFMYISNMQTHVVPKDKITQGTVEELRGYLIKNLPVNRFKSKIK